jgi:hypothetical protein
MRRRGRFPNQAVERSTSDQFPTASANLPSTMPANASPAQTAVQSNPHRRRTAHQPPRVPSSEAFGRRPSARLHRSTTGRHPKPFTIPAVHQTAMEPPGSTPSGHQRRERLNLSLRQIECTSEVRTHILSITYTISAWTMGGSPTAVLPLRCCCRGPAILRSIFGDGVDRHAVYQEPRKLAR